MVKFYPVLVIVLLCLFLFNAQSSSSTDLHNKISELSGRLSQLEKRVDKLESQIRSGGTQSTKGDSSEKNNWRKLRKGMTKNEVTAILGEPRNITVYRYSEVWRYQGMSKVEFDNNGRVTSWSEP